MNNYSRASPAATNTSNTSNSGYDTSSNYGGGFSAAAATAPASQSIDDPIEEQVTQLTLAGLTVLMVRRRDQIIYKLPDNMSVDSLGPDQRRMLMDQINALHAATLHAAAQPSSSAPIPATSRGSTTYTPQQLAQMIEAQQLKVKHMEEEARRRQEALQQLTPLARRQQQGAGTALLPAPSSATSTPTQTPPQTPLHASATGSSVLGGVMSSNEVKTTRKYIKTGKYSKKRMFTPGQGQGQGQLESIMATRPISSPSPTTVMTVGTAQQQQGMGAPGSSAMNPLVGGISGMGSALSGGQQQAEMGARRGTEGDVNAQGVKRLPEEIAHHQEVKRRFTEALAADQRATLQPDVSTPFESIEDVVTRLLPYHIFQIPEEDLKLNREPSEVEATLTAIQLHAKRKKVFNKYYDIIKKEAMNPSPSFLGVLAERLLVDDEKRAGTLVQEEYYRALHAKNELDRREREATSAALQVQIQMQAAQQQQQQQASSSASASAGTGIIGLGGGYGGSGGAGTN
ncbi:hypothetical protein BC937DRAFT_93510, partial [Endogone sp. FLAS-F59071]